MKTCLSILFLPLLLALSAPATAQQTTQDPEVAVADLEHLLLPLTLEEIGAEAGAWRDLLKANVQEIAGVEIELRRASASNASNIGELQTGLTALKGVRDDTIDRMNAVNAALTAKGGDASEYETYVAAVAGSIADVDVSNVGALWTSVQTWATDAEGGLAWARNIVVFLLTLLVFKFLASMFGKITDRAVRRMKSTSDLLRNFLVNSVRKVTFFIGFVLALTALGVNIGPFLAAMGAAGFIIGFALQGTLSNFASGIMILLYRPYDIGDVVSVAGVTGKVEAMSLVSTSVLTPDNQQIVIPNSSIWGDVITNVTANDTRRVDMTFGIGYSDDIDKAQKVLEDVVVAHELVLATPEPVIKVHELADSSVNFVVRPWAKTSDYWAVYWDLQRAVKQRFDAEGISIPFPQQDVYMHQIPAQASTSA